MANRIDGKKIAALLLSDAKQRIESAPTQPGLAVIQVGADPASCCYVRHKRRTCQDIGIESFAHDLSEDTTEDALIALIESLNHNPAIHGIMVQLPLPDHLNAQRICNAIATHKDVDGLSSANLGKVVTGEEDRIIPCTPKGILRILDAIDFPIQGSRCTLIGASNIVGKPLALELTRLGATVTICHKDTQDLAAAIATADCVISAIGKPHVIQTAWLQDATTIIDIGIHKTATGIAGDIDYASAALVAKHITPVPGGVGPVTVAMLMHNTVEAYFRSFAR
jgi:methylenetetrahydrofolate dehydrogenase (NADP+)/methenyltetrahydrofolate cyclohydrolase